MLVAGFPAGAFAANCYIVAPAPGEECVIIDPGQDAQPGIDEVLAEHRLRQAAVLLTHGHIDHVWSVAPVCGAKGIPAYITRTTAHCSAIRQRVSRSGQASNCSVAWNSPNPTM